MLHQEHLLIGLTNNGGYLSQIFQLGNVVYTKHRDKSLKISLIRHTAVDQGGNGPSTAVDILFTNNDLNVPLPLYDLTLEDTTVIPIIRYPKHIQQWLISKVSKKYVLQSPQYKFKPLVTYKIKDPTLTININEQTNGNVSWVMKPANSAMSKDILFIDSSDYRLSTLFFQLNKLPTTGTSIERLIESKVITVPDGSELDIKKYSFANTIVQERVTDFKEYRLIKFPNGTISILDRLHNDSSLPLNNTLEFTEYLGDVEPSGVLHLSENSPQFFHSSEFCEFVRMFAETKGFDFITGSIDLFVKENGEFGIFEFQPQIGVMDVPTVLLEKYRDSLIEYALDKYFLERETNV